MNEVSGKHVVVTGSSRGIGAAAVRLFAEAGARVTLMARSADPIEEIAGEIGESACAHTCDVADFAAVRGAMDAAVSQFGPVDILVNNAGAIEPIAHLGTIDPEAWGAVIDINLKGVFHCARTVLPAMLDRRSGTIVNVSSGAAIHPLEGWSTYCASKAGAKMLTRCMDLEVREHGVRVLGLSPGTVATQMQREIKASGINPVSQLAWEDHIPAQWAARALLWMCSSDADAFLGDDVSLRDPAVRARVGIGSRPPRHGQP